MKQFVLFLGLLCFGLSVNAQNKSVQNEVQAYFNEARTLGNKNQIDQALISLDKAAALAEENKDVKTLIDSYHMFALLYLKLDKVKTTMFYWDRAKTLIKDVEYPYGDAIDKYIEAVLLFKENQNFRALFMLNEARQLNNDRNFFNNILLAEGNIYLKLEKYESASKNYNSLVVNTDVYEKEYLATKANIGLARTNIKLANFEEAAKYAENALALADENAFLAEVIESNQLLAESYEGLGRFK
ncbi:MAG: hybrid sensor histidine kinase/response regulator, partial [Maribacter sp.]|nr:hybrid sensor histidine kinase/response regulator [Maribacter sp.]